MVPGVLGRKILITGDDKVNISANIFLKGGYVYELVYK